MCLGLPMRVQSCDDRFALCEGRGDTRRVDMALVGPQSPGTWVLVFIDAAREVLDDVAAARIDAALDGLEAVLAGSTDVARHFADLVGREPQLPPHLRPQGDAS